MSLASFDTPNAFLHLPDRETTQDGAGKDVPYLFFFLTGNPGLIGYYQKFFNLIAKPFDTKDESSVSSGRSSSPHVIAGFSLGGFEIDHTHAPGSTVSSTSSDQAQDELIQDLMFPPDHVHLDKERNIYGLSDQIELCCARLRHLCTRLQKHYTPQYDRHTSLKRVKVILAGHSVGSYIALEMVRLHHERSKPLHQQQDQYPAPSPSTSPSPQPTITKAGGPQYDRGSFDIVSALLLTPTIIDLANSASGRVAAPLMSTMPFLPSLLQYLSTGLRSLLSRSYLEWIVQRVTGMKSGSPGLQTTVSFLMSRNGVRQALHMARDELVDMTSNKWGDEVWGGTIDLVNDNQTSPPPTKTKSVDGADESKARAPKLFFLFAEKDHWVADVTRDNIVKAIRTRNQEAPAGANEEGNNTSPVVVVDQEAGLVHAWCLEQSEYVADIARTWIAQSMQL